MCPGLSERGIEREREREREREGGAEGSLPRAWAQVMLVSVQHQSSQAPTLGAFDVQPVRAVSELVQPRGQVAPLRCRRRESNAPKVQ